MSMHIEDGNALLQCAKQKGKDWLIYADSKCSPSCVVAKLQSQKDGAPPRRAKLRAATSRADLSAILAGATRGGRHIHVRARAGGQPAGVGVARGAALDALRV